MGQMLNLKLDDQITIRRAETAADYRACQDVQRRAWGITDQGYIVPIATMVGANLHGGLVLGAFLPGGDAAAFSFAFLGRTEGRLCLYSQLTGVVPGYQGRSLGFHIKQLQREIARSEGIELIVWAFDPLQAGNAHFNLSRLGATSHRYIENMYGERTDALNPGVPTDRLIAEWETRETSATPISEEEVSGLPRLIQLGQGGRAEGTATSNEQSPQFAGIPLTEAPRILLEIPEEIAHLRRESPGLAEGWRQAVNQAFRTAFAAGYRAIGFVRDDSSSGRRFYYVLGRT